MVEVNFPEASLPDSALQWFETWRKVGNEHDLKISGPVAKPGSAVLVLLAASMASRRASRLPVEIHWRVEEDSPSASFLGEAAVRFPGTQTVTRADGSQLIGSIQSLAYARIAADALEKQLLSRLPSASPSALRMARFVFEELGANTVQHSGRPETGFGWADIDPATSQFQLAFADCGIGFRSSLERNPELTGRVTDDAEALQLAITPRISGTGDKRKNMGVGLKLLVDFADLLEGTLYVASGGAMLVRKTSAKQRTNTLRPIPTWQGSWICLDARFPS